MTSYTVERSTDNVTWETISDNVTATSFLGTTFEMNTWNDTILDGHHRYKICTENDIAFRTVEKMFESITEAKLWIVKNQSSRQNLTPYFKFQSTPLGGEKL